MKDPVLDGYFLYGHLLILVIAVSVVFAATRHDSWQAILGDCGRWLIRLVLPLAGVGLIAYVLFLSTA